MSLDRTALRLAVVMALTNAYTASYPTLARDMVYDSRLDPVSGIAPGELVPHIVVYTDTDAGKSLSNNNGGPPFDRTVTLIFDLTIGMYGQEGDEVTVFSIPTEPALESMLDLLEAQILDVFKNPQRSPWATRIYDKHIVRIDSWESQRFVDREAKVRIAGRQISVQVVMQQEDTPAIAATPAPAAIPEPLAGLLTAIINGGGDWAETATEMQTLLLANMRPSGLTLQPLQRVRLKEADGGGGNLTADAPARPNGLAQATLT